jgi:hypothetical protein
MAFEPGMYEAVTNVNLRREPRIVENADGNNRVGRLTIGTRREIFETVTDEDNMTWGRVSDFDSAGKAQWVCIVGLNRIYMQRIPLSNQLLESRLRSLETWARTNGYKG